MNLNHHLAQVRLARILRKIAAGFAIYETLANGLAGAFFGLALYLIVRFAEPVEPDWRSKL